MHKKNNDNILTKTYILKKIIQSEIHIAPYSNSFPERWHLVITNEAMKIF